MTLRPSEVRARLMNAGTAPLLLDLAGNSRTGPALAAAVDRVAGALRDDMRPHPKVGLWYANGLAAIEAFLAVEWAGGTRIPVDPNASAQEARAVFDAASVDIVVADEQHAAMLNGPYLVHDDGRPLAGRVRAPLESDDAAVFMIYPRTVIGGELFGIPLTYGNWRAIIGTNIDLFRSGRYGAWQERSEVFLSAQQIMHGTGFLGTFPFLAMGLPQVVAERFDVEPILAAVERHSITATMFVPAMLRALLNAGSDIGAAMRSMRHLLYGGGPLSADEILAAVDRLGAVLTQVYGRVEGGWPLSVLSTEDHAAMRAHPQLTKSCGRLIAEVAAELRPLSGRPADRGELAVKSAMTSPEFAGPDGWCSLGDIMRRDDDGYLYFEGRLDRMVNTGYHVYPDEIEAIIRQVEGVDRVLVAGEPHPRWGEMLVAYVVPSDETSPPDALKAVLHERVAERLARYKVPREFRIVSALPVA